MLCSFHSGYVAQLWNEMQKRYSDIEYSLFTSEENSILYNKELDIRTGCKIYTFDLINEYSFPKKMLNVRKASRLLPRFDIVHSLWIEPYWAGCADILHGKTSTWFASVGGSDLYRESKVWCFKILQKQMLKKCNWYSAENQQTVDYFYQIYSGREYRKPPMTINRFGVDVLDEFSKIQDKDAESICNSLGIPMGMCNIVCGTNARKEQQHLEIINQIKKMNKGSRDKCCFIFPVTYGEPYQGYLDLIKRELEKLNIRYVLIRKYMNPNEMARLMSVSDVLIHIQTTDQLSSTMLGYMYAGKVVITGKWLPYGGLRDNKIYFLDIDNVGNLAEGLSNVVNNYSLYHDRCAGNTDAVYKMSSWDSASTQWYDVYERLCAIN